MSQFFKQADYAEDQPNAYTILTTHVLYRGFQAGALVGIGLGLVRSRHLFSRTAKAVAAGTSGHTISAKQGQSTRILLSTTARSSVIGLGLMGPALIARMWGRDEIEWKDRSWRLLSNAGQVEVDQFSILGTAAGAPLALLLATQTGLSMAVVGLGGAGIGSSVGILGYMLYRYGMHQGRRDAEETRKA